MCDVPSQEVYSTLAKDLYADTSASPMHDYPTCGPAESPNNQNYEYVQTRKLDKSEATTYEVPTTLATSKWGHAMNNFWLDIMYNLIDYLKWIDVQCAPVSLILSLK